MPGMESSGSFLAYKSECEYENAPKATKTDFEA